jgi:hypothetical protein
MKESQTVGRDINSFFSVKILYCTIAGPMVTQILITGKLWRAFKQILFNVTAILAAKSEF